MAFRQSRACLVLARLNLVASYIISFRPLSCESQLSLEWRNIQFSSIGRRVETQFLRNTSTTKRSLFPIGMAWGEDEERRYGGEEEEDELDENVGESPMIIIRVEADQDLRTTKLKKMPYCSPLT